MAKKNLTDKRHPKATAVYAQNEPFDNAFVALDNPDDATIKQYGNGETMVKNDNPDDLESLPGYGMEN